MDLSEFDRSINVAINKILYQNKFDLMNAYLLFKPTTAEKDSKKMMKK